MCERDPSTQTPSGTFSERCSSRRRLLPSAAPSRGDARAYQVKPLAPRGHSPSSGAAPTVTPSAASACFGAAFPRGRSLHAAADSFAALSRLTRVGRLFSSAGFALHIRQLSNLGAKESPGSPHWCAPLRLRYLDRGLQWVCLKSRTRFWSWLSSMSQTEIALDHRP